ncbi:MAG: CHAT domain-containing protein [Saprospiraceae bacterium]|nr:CHAT domain-containing protein [Saprospiraceae bacterium]
MSQLVQRSLDNREFDKAIELNTAAEAFSLEKFGASTEQYGDMCFQHAKIFFVQNDYDRAGEWYGKARDVYEKAIGKQQIRYAAALNGLAKMYLRRGNYVEAEQICTEAKSIFEAIGAQGQVDYAVSLHNAAWLNQERGKYDAAVKLYKEAIATRQRILGEGKTDIDLGWSMNNLATVYYLQGEYELAEEYHTATAELRQKLLGRGHPSYAVSLINLGALQTDLRNYDKGEQLYLKAKAIFEDSLHLTEHYFYTMSLVNLGDLNIFKQEYKRAEGFLIQAKTIFEKTNNTQQQLYLKCLYSLVACSRNLGKKEQARDCSRIAKQVQEGLGGKTHPWYALGLVLESYDSFDNGEYAKAVAQCEEAKQVLESSMGEQNDIYLDMMLSLARAFWRKADFEAAALTVAKAYEIEKTMLLNGVQHLSEQELSAYVTRFVGNQGLMLSFASKQSDLAATCFDNALFHKGFLLNAMMQVNHFAHKNPETEAAFNDLKTLKRQFARQLAKPKADRDETVVTSLQDNISALEKELARSVSGLGEAMRQVTWKEVQGKLAATEAAIEFVHFRYHNPMPTDSIVYAAILTTHNSQQPIFISLFEEKQLDSLLAPNSERKADYVNGLYTVAERGLKPKGKPQRTLYELLWQPLEKALEGKKTLYFAPTGLLHRINLGAIPINDETTIADRFGLVEMGSTRQLIVGSHQSAVGRRGAALFGGVQYEMDSTAIVAANSQIQTDLLASRSTGSRGLSFSETDASQRGGTWSYLKWTDMEVAAIETILKNASITCNLSKGYEATEEAFKSIGIGIPSPTVLHIATHGYFFPDVKSGANTPSSEAGKGEAAFKTSEHPMIRSGLLLAGANHAWQTGQPLHPDLEDGILTAYEISQMNLQNTELVVLSACETGLGDIQGNEGVYGLQRAFKIAGAKYLVMSLWQVPDQETSVFMTQFYRHWLEDKMTIPDAFRAAQKEMRERFINPYQWAGFVLVE